MECSVALTRGDRGNNGAILRKSDENQTTSTHTPTSARGFCLFDSPDTYWKNGYCPYEPNNSHLSHNVIERIDSGSHYYKKHFYGQGKKNIKLIMKREPDTYFSVELSKVSLHIKNISTYSA